MSSKGKLTSLVLLVAICLLMVPVLSPRVSAFPYRLEGYLEDSDGNPIPHATIVLTGTVFNMTTQSFGPGNITTTTDNSGYYRINVGVDEPGGLVGDETVTLSFDDGERSVSEPLTLTGTSAWKNLTASSGSNPLDFLLSPIGLVILVVGVTAIVIAIFAFTSREKEEESATEEARDRAGRRRK